MKVRAVSVIKYGLISISILLILDILLVLVESRHPQPLIETLGEAVWYSLVTLAAVGYGDYYPLTPAGRVIGYLLVIGSIALLGIIITMVSKNIFTMLEERKLGFMGTQFTRHVMVIGWNDFSRSVINEVLSSKRKLAIITNNKDEVDLIRDAYSKKDVYVLFSDYHNLQALEKARPNEAAQVFVNLGNDTEALLYVVNFRKYYKKPQLVVSIDNSRLEETFMAAGVTYVVSRNEIASKLVASYIFEPDVAMLNLDILSAAKSTGDHDNQEFQVTANNPYLNKPYMQAFLNLKEKYNAVLLGICKKTNQKLLTNPAHEEIIEMGDYLILMVNGKQKEALEKDFGINQGRIC